MALLTRMLCRLWSGAAPGPRRREREAEKAKASPTDETSQDDLTAISGIGGVAQNCLYAEGIKSYAQLAQASPEEVERILGKLARGADVEEWIARAKKLAKQRKS